VGIGSTALANNTTGQYNVGIGYRALGSNIGGSYNIAIGCSTLYTNTTGSYNIAIGCSTLYTNTTGSYNIGLGYVALCSNTGGTNNIAIGCATLQKNTNGQYNVGIGSTALANNTSGSYNVVLGCGAGYSSLTGSSNVFIGNCAGYSETSSNKLHIANTSTCDLIYGDFVANYVQLPTLKLCTTPTTGVCTDSVLTWNSSTCIVGKLPYSNASIFGYTITGDGSTTGFTITHSLGTREVAVQVYENQAPYGTVIVAVQRTSTSAVNVLFTTAPPVSTNYKVLIIK
jgi:hypothetical protein